MYFFKKNYLLFLLLIISIFIPKGNFATENDSMQNYVIVGKKNFISQHEAFNENNSINVVIEIPSGTNEKWEVSKDGMQIELEFNNGIPRQINYLGYPANYGFIPKTLLPLSEQGDGDAVDVVLLGPKLDRGSVVKAEVISMLVMFDNGQIDNKIIAVLENSKFSNSTSSVDFFRKKYPGLLDIIQLWFTNYKGVNLVIKGYTNKKRARNFIIKANEYYKQNYE